MKRFTALTSAVLSLLLVLASAPHAWSTGKDKQARIQGQMDVKIIHVDKWGVYVPNIVFYWDNDLGKQKVAALTSLAEKSRNKLVTIVYSTLSEIGKDKRPLVVEITPVKEQAPIPGFDQKPANDPGNAAYGAGEGPKVYLSDPVRVAPSYDAEMPAESADSREESDPSQLASANSKGTEPIPLVRDKPLQSSPGNMVISNREVQMLVEHMLHLTEKKSLDSLVYYYGDQVNYYGRGDVTKDYIRKDMGYYFKNWDTIVCTLASDVVLVDTDRSDTKIVRFTSRYAVESPKKSLSGRTDNTWKVQKTATGLKVIDQKQSILRSEPQ
jgi:hypothetical protein